jgi:hypothetical protein
MLLFKVWPPLSYCRRVCARSRSAFPISRLLFFFFSPHRPPAPAKQVPKGCYIRPARRYPRARSQQSSSPRGRGRQYPTGTPPGVVGTHPHPLTDRHPTWHHQTGTPPGVVGEPPSRHIRDVICIRRRPIAEQYPTGTPPAGVCNALVHPHPS